MSKYTSEPHGVTKHVSKFLYSYWLLSAYLLLKPVKIQFLKAHKNAFEKIALVDKLIFNNCVESLRHDL